MGKPDPILRETFRICGLPYSVFLFHHQIAWCPQKKGGEDMSEWINVKLKDVLSVEVIYTKDEGRTTKSSCCLPRLKGKSSVSLPSQYLVINYAQVKKDSDKWRSIELQLAHDNFSLLNKWCNAIQSALDEFKQRPKNLLFIINPYGGKRKAVSIFEQHVKPILQLSKIKWTIIHTQRRNHATEILASMSDQSLAEYDVVVAVGGDGTICEVVSGLLTREMSTSSAIDETDLKPACIPVAVIGAGSTNALAFTINGTDDPETGVIHIVLGGSLPLDVGAVHNHSGIARFIVGQMSYGYMADLMVHSENLRWMGPKRYDYAGFRKFLSHAVYEGSIEMKVANDDNRKIPSQCLGGKGCDDCDELLNPSNSNGEWKRVEGRFIGVSGANISCRCSLSPQGMAPFAHLSDGHMELIVIRQTSRLSHLRYLLRTTGDSRRAFALPFVERYRVNEFIFTPVQCCNNNSKMNIADGNGNNLSTCGCDSKQQEKMHSVWNCDGELLYQPSVRVTVHRNLVRIMARSQSNNNINSIISQSYEPDGISLSHTVSTNLMTRSPSVETKEIDPSVISLEECSLSAIRF